MTATAYTGGSLRAAGPSFAVTFTVADPFTVAHEGTVPALDDDRAAIASRCTNRPWAVVPFEGTGEHALPGSFHGLAGHCSYDGPLPDRTIGPNSSRPRDSGSARPLFREGSGPVAGEAGW